MLGPRSRRTSKPVVNALQDDSFNHDAGMRMGLRHEHILLVHSESEPLHLHNRNRFAAGKQDLRLCC